MDWIVSDAEKHINLAGADAEKDFKEEAERGQKWNIIQDYDYHSQPKESNQSQNLSG